MIQRYTRTEMGAVWSDERRMQGWLDVELAATDALAAAGRVPADAAAACRERASFTVEAVKERERTTNHDVAAFVDVVAASVGDEGRWIHYGLTSSDVLDTALALQLVEAGAILIEGATTSCATLSNLAPRAGFEPATCRLTVECSTAELPGITARRGVSGLIQMLARFAKRFFQKNDIRLHSACLSPSPVDD